MGHNQKHGLGNTDNHDTATLALVNALISDLTETYGGLRDIGVGTFAQRPAAGTANKLWFATDVNKMFRDNGVSWDIMLKVLDFKSAMLYTGSIGAHYTHGFYNAPATSATISQAGATQTLGAVNVPYGAYAFLVASGAGSASGGAGVVEIEVSGTSVTDAGIRTTSDTEVIVVDVTAMTTNAYYETVKKWVGQVTYTIQNAGAGTHTTYSATFNYGFAKYDDFGNRAFTITDFEMVGEAGANNAGFDVELLHHRNTGWTYHATAFVPGDGAICKLSTDYVTEFDLDNGVPFAYKRSGLSIAVDGSDTEGVLVRITTSATNAIEHSTINIGVEYD